MQRDVLNNEIIGYFVQCSIDHAKRSFYKAANSVFGKIGRIASEEVTLQLVKSKCIPILLYGLKVCELKSQMASLDFTINRFFMKLFSTIRYDSRYLTCSKKLTGSQLSLPHGINRKLKCETKNKMLSVISPVRSRYHEAVQ